MKRGLLLAAGAAALMLAAACTEKPQTNAQGVKYDATPWSGTGVQANSGTPFTAPGYQPGNQKAWQEQLKNRMQYGQNEYTRAN
ncbi:conserved hypothetical protein [Burkholderiales bacterium 8X]|nr:conserved hypothetical protein [Burkholderiales bacterium 8X]